MKPAHRRILNALADGYGVKCLGRQRFAWVSKWVSYGKYSQFRVRLSTLREMEECGLVRCVDQYSHDREWTLTETQP